MNLIKLEHAIFVLAKMCEEFGFKFIFASSCSVYGNEKLQTEYSSEGYLITINNFNYLNN